MFALSIFTSIGAASGNGRLRRTRRPEIDDERIRDRNRRPQILRLPAEVPLAVENAQPRVQPHEGAQIALGLPVSAPRNHQCEHRNDHRLVQIARKRAADDGARAIPQQIRQGGAQRRRSALRTLQIQGRTHGSDQRHVSPRNPRFDGDVGEIHGEEHGGEVTGGVVEVDGGGNQQRSAEFPGNEP
ncbi:hypothetical protein L596_023245 [Steinernema carpocapsae]|uniref:Uncharacterized protein n=1 Tax=Steinernema carpocapsae TaxID=34508 RepID=A0A4U5MD28_STECR|nr:hypothetical protein L596_023245 [Steinernema carpocapsae]